MGVLYVYLVHGTVVWCECCIIVWLLEIILISFFQFEIIYLGSELQHNLFKLNRIS
jgi:hypothetical protein